MVVSSHIRSHPGPTNPALLGSGGPTVFPMTSGYGMPTLGTSGPTSFFPTAPAALWGNYNWARPTSHPDPDHHSLSPHSSGSHLSPLSLSPASSDCSATYEPMTHVGIKQEPERGMDLSGCGTRFPTFSAQVKTEVPPSYHQSPATLPWGPVPTSTAVPQPWGTPYSTGDFSWLNRFSKTPALTQAPQPAAATGGKTRTREKYRMVYSDYQRLELEKEFHFNKYITMQRKNELSKSLGLSDRQIKIWFQNRRAKERKSMRRSGLPVENTELGKYLNCHQSHTSPDSTLPRPDLAPARPDLAPARPDLAPARPDLAHVTPSYYPGAQCPEVTTTQPRHIQGYPHSLQNHQSV